MHHIIKTYDRLRNMEYQEKKMDKVLKPNFIKMSDKDTNWKVDLVQNIVILFNVK